ncbi:MAG: hypothetical protein ACSHYA_15370 [Opitutaceae bacterium]
MANILSHGEWMKSTNGGRLSVRSSQLKAVDEALKKYHLGKTPSQLEALQGALMKWMQSKGAGWKTSVRNRTNAVDTLYKQVTGLGTGQSKDPLALSRIRDESRAIITDLFQGKQLIYRSGVLTKLAGAGTLGRAGAVATIGSVVNNARIVGKGAGASGASGSNASMLSEKLISTFVPAEVKAEVLQAMVGVMPDFLVQLKASVAPFVGVITSGGSALISIASATRAQYRVDRAGMHAERTLSAEEPEAAFLALIRMLERERTTALVNLARSMAEFGGKLASTLADGGAVTNSAIGLASGVVKLTHLLLLVVRDVLERTAANRLLREPIITIKLFEANPLMGAYLICCAPTSVLVNTMLSSERFYEPGMMDKVEHAVKKHIGPLREQAQRLIKEHRMYFRELDHFPGVMSRNEGKLKAMMERKGKTKIGRAGFGSDSFS